MLLLAFWTSLVLAPMLSGPVEFHTLILSGRKRSIFFLFAQSFLFNLLGDSHHCLLYFFRHYFFFFQNTFSCTVLSRASRTVKYTINNITPTNMNIDCFEELTMCSCFSSLWDLSLFFFFPCWVDLIKNGKKKFPGFISVQFFSVAGLFFDCKAKIKQIKNHF